MKFTHDQIMQLLQPVSEIQFSKRVRDCLNKADILYVFELAQSTEQNLQFQGQGKFGKKSINEVNAHLRTIGVQLNTDLGIPKDASVAQAEGILHGMRAEVAPVEKSSSNVYLDVIKEIFYGAWKLSDEFLLRVAADPELQEASSTLLQEAFIQAMSTKACLEEFVPYSAKEAWIIANKPEDMKGVVSERIPKMVARNAQFNNGMRTEINKTVSRYLPETLRPYFKFES